jgi:glycosyltransferase involved in cell wall biosynthesis
MSSLRIVHVTTFYPPHTFGGDGVHVQRLAEAQIRRGHEVEVAYSPAAFAMLDRYGGGLTTDVTEGDRRAGDGAPRVRPTTDPSDRLEPLLIHQTGGPVLSRRRLEEILQPGTDSGPDVIHFHNVSLVGGVGVLGIGDAVKLYTAHEYWLVCPTHLLFRFGREPCTRRTCVRCTVHSGRPPQWWRYTHSRDRAAAQVDRAIYPSASTREHYREQGLDLPGEVFHHFLPDGYRRGAAALGARSTDVDRYFLYVGRLDAVKGIDRLAHHFATTDPPAPLRVVGDGPLGETLRRRYAGHPKIEFLGTLTSDRLGPLYRDALALILPSAGYEIFGLVVAEALAHGTPAIVSELCGAAEIVAEADAGAVYSSSGQLDEALQEIAADEAARRQMGERGQRFVGEHLGEDDYLERYERFVEEIRAEKAS